MAEAGVSNRRDWEGILGWLPLLLWAAVLSSMLFGLVGVVEYGKNLIVPSCLSALLAVVLAGRLILERRADVFDLLPIPFLLYAIWNRIEVSPLPWLADLQLVLMINAYVAFLTLRRWALTRTRQWACVGTFAVLVLIAIAFAAYQGFIDPDYFPLSGHRRTVYYMKRPSGLFGNPNTFSAFLILTLPLFAGMALLRRYPFIIRLGSGLLALVAGGFVLLAASRGAILALAVVTLIAPFVLFHSFRARIHAMCCLALLAGAVMGPLFVLDSVAIQRAKKLFQQPDTLARPVIWKGTWEMFRDAPLSGQGVGSFAETWPRFRPPGRAPYLAPETAHSDYLQTLAETGLIGFGLLYGWAPLVAASLYLRWKRLPYGLVRERNEGGRLRRQHDPRHRSDPASRAVVPARRILISGLGLGTVAFCLHAAVDFHFNVGFTSVAFASVCALMMNAAGLSWDWRRLPAIPSMVLAVGLLGAAGWWFAEGKAKAEAQNGYFTVQTRVDRLLRWGLRPQEKNLLEQELPNYRRILEKNPGMWTAYRDRGIARLALADLEARDSDAISSATLQEALADLEFAFSFPESRSDYRLNLYLGNGYMMAGKSFGEVVTFADTALRLAPNTPETHTLMAKVVWGYLGDHQSALRHLQTAIELDHRYQLAKRIRRQIEAGK